MLRPSQVLALIVAGAALAGAGVWLGSHHGADGATDGWAEAVHLKPEELNSVTQLRIFKGDGSHATLRRDGARWSVVERGYPADTGQVRKLLLDLSNLQVEEQKTTDPALYSKLGVEDPTGASAMSTGLDVDINGRTWRLIVGKTSGTRSVYLRAAGEAASLLASPPLTPDADPRHWLDRSLLDISPEQIIGIGITLPGTPQYTLKRSAAGSASDFTVSPIPKGRRLADPSAPASQAAGLAGLQFDDVRKAGTPGAPAHAIFESRDGLSLAVAGIQDGERRYISVVATATTPAAQVLARDLNARLAGWEFELPGYRYDALFRPLEQLLVPKPSAAPAAGTPKEPYASPVATPNALPFGPRSH